MTSILQGALAWSRAGCSLVPIQLYEPEKPEWEKAPAWKLLPKVWDEGEQREKHSWKPFMERRPEEAELRAWFTDNLLGMSVVCGAVSGNLLVLDFDRPGIYEEYAALCDDNGITDLIESCPLVETPSGGRHLYVRCEEPVPGSQRLAQTVTIVEAGTPKARPYNGGWAVFGVLIETRAEGSMAIAPPSPKEVHSAGRPYRFLRGRPNSIPVVSMQILKGLLNLARCFDEYVEPERIHLPSPARERISGEGLRPGDDFDERGDYEKLLEDHGWTRLWQRGEKTGWKHPGRKDGLSATTGHGGRRMLWVFSSSAFPFEPEKGYSPFGVYTLLEHGGSFSGAAQALYQQDFGDRVQPRAVLSVPGEDGETVEPPVEIRPEYESVEAWKKAGKKLVRWKAAVDDLYRWKIGRWVNAIVADIQHGEKDRTLQELFDKSACTVRKWASVESGWPEDERTSAPFWVHSELSGKPKEERSRHMADWLETPCSREDFRAKIGAETTKRPPKGWRKLSPLLDDQLADFIEETVWQCGGSAVYGAIKSSLYALRKRMQSDPNLSAGGKNDDREEWDGALPIDEEAILEMETWPDIEEAEPGEFCLIESGFKDSLIKENPGPILSAGGKNEPPTMAIAADTREASPSAVPVTSTPPAPENSPPKFSASGKNDDSAPILEKRASVSLSLEISPDSLPSDLYDRTENDADPPGVTGIQEYLLELLRSGPLERDQICELAVSFGYEERRAVTRALSNLRSAGRLEAYRTGVSIGYALAIPTGSPSG